MLFVVTIVATRFLSVADFGEYAIVASFMFLSRALFYVGPYEYLLKAKSEEGLFASCCSANILLAAGAGIVLLGVAAIAPALFGSADIRRLTLWLLPSVFLASITAWYEAILLRKLMIRRYYGYTVVGEIVGSAASIALLASGFGLMSMVAQVYGRLLSLLLLYAIATRQRPALSIDDDTLTVLKWSSSRYAAVLLNFGSNYGADLMLGIFLSPAATGIYRASNRIVSALTDLFAQPLQKIAQTNLSARAAAGLPPNDGWTKMLASVGALGWTMMAGLAFIAKDLVPLALGAKWAPAVPVVMVFCFIRAFSILDAVTTSLLVSYDRQHRMLAVQITVSALVLLCSWLISGYGPLAVAAAVGAITVSMSLVYCGMTMRLSGVTFRKLASALTTSAIPLAVIAATMTALNAFAPIRTGNIVDIIVHIAIGAAAVGAAMLVIKRRLFEAIGALAHHSSPAGYPK